MKFHLKRNIAPNLFFVFFIFRQVHKEFKQHRKGRLKAALKATISSANVNMENGMKTKGALNFTIEIT